MKKKDQDCRDYWRVQISRWKNDGHGGKKCSLVSTSVPHGHIRLTISLKPCLILCSCKWLSFNLKSVIVDFALLTSGLSLFHSSIQQGKKAFLMLFDRDGTGFNFLADTDFKR